MTSNVSLRIFLTIVPTIIQLCPVNYFPSIHNPLQLSFLQTCPLVLILTILSELRQFWVPQNCILHKRGWRHWWASPRRNSGSVHYQMASHVVSQSIEITHDHFPSNSRVAWSFWTSRDLVISPTTEYTSVDPKINRNRITTPHLSPNTGIGFTHKKKIRTPDLLFTSLHFIIFFFKVKWFFKARRILTLAPYIPGHKEEKLYLLPQSTFPTCYIKSKVDSVQNTGVSWGVSNTEVSLWKVG
jgi:hypothetical protein